MTTNLILGVATVKRIVALPSNLAFKKLG